MVYWSDLKCDKHITIDAMEDAYRIFNAIDMIHSAAQYSMDNPRISPEELAGRVWPIMRYLEPPLKSGRWCILFRSYLQRIKDDLEYVLRRINIYTHNTAVSELARFSKEIERELPQLKIMYDDWNSRWRSIMPKTNLCMFENKGI